MQQMTGNVTMSISIGAPGGQDSKRREIWGAELHWWNNELSFNLSVKKQIALAKRVPDHYIYVFFCPGNIN